MLLIAILLMAVMFVLIPWVDRMQKRRKEEWVKRRKRLMAIGDDDAIEPTSLAKQRTPGAEPEPSRDATPETGNPYQPPRV